MKRLLFSFSVLLFATAAIVASGDAALADCVDTQTLGCVEIPTNTADSSAVNRIFGAVYAVLASAALIYLIIAGIRYMVSTGNPESTQKARNGIIYAIIGLVVIAFAYGITDFVIGAIE